MAQDIKIKKRKELRFIKESGKNFRDFSNSSFGKCFKSNKNLTVQLIDDEMEKLFCL